MYPLVNPSHAQFQVRCTARTAKGVELLHWVNQHLSVAASENLFGT